MLAGVCLDAIEGATLLAKISRAQTKEGTADFLKKAAAGDEGFFHSHTLAGEAILVPAGHLLAICSNPLAQWEPAFGFKWHALPDEEEQVACAQKTLSSLLESYPGLQKTDYGQWPTTFETLFPGRA